MCGEKEKEEREDEMLRAEIYAGECGEGWDAARLQMPRDGQLPRHAWPERSPECERYSTLECEQALHC